MAYCWSPSHIIVLRLYRKYSDSAIRIRRTSSVDACGACTSIGSLVAKISTPAARSSFSSRRLASMSRPTRLMSSQIAAANGQSPEATAARSSAMPSVAGDARPGELLPQAGPAASVQLDPAGLHIPVAPDDDEPFGQPFAGQPVLAGQRHDGVLEGGCGGAADERYPDRALLLWPAGACPLARNSAIAGTA